MKLFEFQAKEIFRKYNIPTSTSSYLIKNAEEVNAILDKLQLPCVLKAQVLSGGRGKAGGVKIAKTKEEISKLVEQIFNLVINGEKTCAILIEDYVNIEKELYTSITIDTTTNNVTILASSLGGIDIEELTLKHPEMIFKMNVDPFVGIKTYQARLLARKLGLSGRLVNVYAHILTSMYRILRDYDAELVEINPLALTKSGELVAVDAKIVLNEPAKYRHQETFEQLEKEQEALGITRNLKEIKLKELGCSAYIDFEKEGIALISDGAGIGMYAYDTICQLGGSVASYCELGLANTPEKISRVLEIVSSDPKTRVLLINWFGGANIMDEMCKGIIQFREKNNSIPIIVRVAGTNFDKAHEMLKNANIFVTEDINEAVNKVISFSGGIS
ncbi:acetate--CoA ligase family protein [Thermococcus aggregans]|uniref:Acetate--CoA ligase family protein n=1 Tax=Thermococcus aggregans TaxID=110163 RepID=A0A9E7MW72_THEAG|nr:ATP-grasp domain-containing protein [Thermococcus aggregans]USS40051.1 acetate--CoA ligase family protein [Thermococcus aggregans]